ncbi:MAG TPA: thymidylate synthase, partial [Dehalococcoidia bacterium]|nr:thymidylate synthase [Dehalococcoidia bacterium]
VTISNSAHLYEDTWELAKAVVSKHYDEVRSSGRKDGRDPRGNFAIRIEDGKIIIEHYSPDGRYLRTTSGRTAREVSKDLLTYVSTPEHALYLGLELEKAEMALRYNLAYTQDHPLKLGHTRLSNK